MMTWAEFLVFTRICKDLNEAEHRIKRGELCVGTILSDGGPGTWKAATNPTDGPGNYIGKFVWFKKKTERPIKIVRGLAMLGKDGETTYEVEFKVIPPKRVPRPEALELEQLSDEYSDYSPSGVRID